MIISKKYIVLALLLGTINGEQVDKHFSAGYTNEQMPVHHSHGNHKHAVHSRVHHV